MNKFKSSKNILLLSKDSKNRSLFNDLFKIYYDSLVGFAYSYLKSEDEAKDIVQEVFLRVWNMVDELNSDKNIRSLLFTSTKNKCISVLRHRTVVQEHVSDEASRINYQAKIDLLALKYSTINEIEFNELNRQLDDIIASLPDDYRTIFQLHRKEGLSYAEISERLGISQKTVDKKITATLKIFRNKLRDDYFIIFLFLQ